MTYYLLTTWEANKKPDSQSSLQGKVSLFSDKQIAFVVNVFKDYVKERKRIKIKAFIKHLKIQWQNQPWLTPAPSRKTVMSMLEGNGRLKIKNQANKKQSYHPPLKRFFPHAQTVLDGKEVTVFLGGQSFDFVMELSKDMASDALGGFDVAKTETAELVKSAFENHSHNHQRPLAALIDNGSGNKKAAIDLGAEGVLVIKAYPYRAETKGQIEGEFGLFERTVSHIVIDGQTTEQQACSILKKIAEIYLRLRNQTPRCSTCPFTPEKLMRAEMDSVAAEKAYSILKAQQELKAKQQEQRLKITAEFNDLIESIVKEHQLSGDLLRFKKSLKWIEISTLKEAEYQFAVQSKRDTFDPAKRNMAYFYAIAKNLQIKADQTRREKVAYRRYSLDRQAKEKRLKIKLVLEEQKRQQIIAKAPHLRVIQALKGEMSLPPDFRKTVTIFKKKMDEALLSILRKNHAAKQNFVNKIHEEVMSLSEFSLETRYQIINQVNNRLKELSPSLKVVTSI